MKTNVQINARIKEVRDELNRTQLFLDLLGHIAGSGFALEALAKEAGVAPATLYFWVSGYVKSPRVDTLVKVATALGLDVRLHQTRKVAPTAQQRKLRVVK